jgi:hypothetical protein
MARQRPPTSGLRPRQGNYPPQGGGKLVQFHADNALVTALKTWIRRQPDAPSRVEAIRRLLLAGLKDQGFHDNPTREP